LFFDYFRQKNLNIKVARIFNTYGPKMQFDDGRVVSNFIVQCLLNEAITIYGNGSQTRSFCYVDDMVDGLIKLMNTSKSVTGPLNLGNTGEISIKDLSSIIVEITKSKSSIRFLNLPQDDPKQRKPNIDLAYKEILWLPKVGIYEGLTKTIKYFKENL
jgi:UDP-glucuronate decarboxylase